MFGLGKPRHQKWVLAILDRVSGKLTANEIAEVRGLVINHEQPAAALNLISGWLYEHQVEISPEDFEAIRSACEKMEMHDANWEMLGAIVRE
ncbi:MAG: hypothetical protein ACRBBN_03845 [Methyloligellaceae bacterium]